MLLCANLKFLGRAPDEDRARAVYTRRGLEGDGARTSNGDGTITSETKLPRKFLGETCYRDEFRRSLSASLALYLPLCPACIIRGRTEQGQRIDGGKGGDAKGASTRRLLSFRGHRCFRGREWCDGGGLKKVDSAGATEHRGTDTRRKRSRRTIAAPIGEERQPRRD